MGKLLSFDPHKYSPWQRRTFYCCAFMFVLSVVLATVGVVFVVLAEFFGIKSIDLVPGVVLGGETLVAGIVGIIVALSGIIGAKDPRKITLFFWIVTLYGLLELWDLARSSESCSRHHACDRDVFGGLCMECARANRILRSSSAS